MCEEQRVFRPVGGWLLVLALGKQAGKGTGYGEGHAAQGHGQSGEPVHAGLGQGGHGAVGGSILHRRIGGVLRVHGRLGFVRSDVLHGRRGGGLRADGGVRGCLIPKLWRTPH